MWGKRWAPHDDLVRDPIEPRGGLLEVVLPRGRHREEPLVDLTAQVVQRLLPL